jgi:hypothetical protein
VSKKAVRAAAQLLIRDRTGEPAGDRSTGSTGKARGRRVRKGYRKATERKGETCTDSYVQTSLVLVSSL